MNSLLSKYLLYYPATLVRGELIFKYLSSYKKFQWLNKTEIEQHQLTHLKKLLHYAYENSPYYQSKLSGIDLNSIEKLSDIQKLPFLSKNDVSTQQQNLLTERFFSSKKTTGGSTGQAVTIMKNPDALARERAATWRCYNWAGVSIGDPQARFWGVPIKTKGKIFYEIVDFISNRKRFSAFDYNKNKLKSYIKTLHEFKPNYLYGYASMIFELALFVKENNYQLPDSIKSVITTSEVLTAQMQAEIENTFKLKVFNEYGCGEVGSIAHECEQGNMHIMADNLIVEVIGDDGLPAKTGEIVVTDLFNISMPLIRYKLADYASLSDEPCSCGVNLPVISGIHGRAYDIIKTSSGKSYHPEIIMYIFEELKEKTEGINQFQFIQKKLNEIEIIIVKGKGFKEGLEEVIVKTIHDKIDASFEIKFFYKDEIKREKSGKIRLVKSEVKGY